MAVDGWIINQHVRDSRSLPLPPQHGLHPPLAQVRAGQSGALLPPSRCIPPLIQIALEIIIATIAALYSIYRLAGWYNVRTLHKKLL